MAYFECPTWYSWVSFSEYPTPYSRVSYSECPTPYQCALLHRNTIWSPASYKNPSYSGQCMQFLKAGIRGNNLAIHPINKEDGYDLTSVPSPNNIVPQVYHCKEPLHCRWIDIAL